jgi:hypothetical protein
MTGMVVCVGAAWLARSKLVSVIEVRLGGTTRELKCFLSFVANHYGLISCTTVAFAAANIRGHNTPTGN